MLLDLFAARAEGRSVSVTSACLAAGVAPSTAAGWLKLLERGGHVVRHPDPTDGRRMLLEIGDRASIGVERWLNATFLQ
jgi:DNA-binding MarR family transcriptional regulator